MPKRMDDRDVARHWDDNAPDWTSGVRAGYDVSRIYVNNPAFFGMLGDIKGQRVLDVGCGEGTNTRKYADLGAKVVGVDVSGKMIEAAHEHEAKELRGIEYHVTSGADLRRFPDALFDAVLSNMAIMDMADWQGCIREVARVLKAGGLFQFSISHPCTMTRRWKWILDEQGRRLGFLVGNYFRLIQDPPGKEVDEWFFGAAPAEAKAKARKFRIPVFFRTLSEYHNTLVDSGFIVERLAEPCPSNEAIAACPGIADNRVAPFFLVFRCRKR